MLVEDYPSPVAPYLVLLLLIREQGPLSTTRLARDVGRRTSDTYGGHIGPVKNTLEKLERDGVLTSSRPSGPRPTRLWALTEDGQWFLDEALAVLERALGGVPRRHGGSDGEQAQRH